MRIEQHGYKACCFGELEVGQCFTDFTGDIYLKVVDGSLPSQSMPSVVNLSNDTLYYFKSETEVTPITAEVQIKSRLKGVEINNEDSLG